MDYIKKNKEAWEEAFDHRLPDWEKELYDNSEKDTLPFWNADAVKELKKMDLINKTIAQFCCNNGRELLSLMRLGAHRGVGFDIAENMIAHANDVAKMKNINCEFVSCNILEIDEKYYNKFDFVCFTIGAITWFKDLEPLFNIVSKCLKKDGVLFIHDFHPLMNILPFPDEDGFDSDNLGKMQYSYFREEPWIEDQGMTYLAGNYKSKEFISFTHTMSSIINSIINSGMKISSLTEYDYDIGITEVYNGMGLPQSFILLANR